MGLIEVISLGVDEHHARTHVIDRPHGVPYYLYLNFLTPMELRFEGVPARAEPGDVLVYGPGFGHYYTGRDVGFVDNWMHFDGGDVRRLMERYALPVNTVFRPSTTHFVGPIMKDIIRERLRREPHWEEEVSALAGRLLRMTGRALRRHDEATLSRVETEHLVRLRDVRSRVLTSLRTSWRVERMAELAHLSPSRFATLYTKLIGTPPMEDLITARLDLAKSLLTNSATTVASAARQCGFPCVSHFSRIFRKRVGCAPRDYATHMDALA